MYCGDMKCLYVERLMEVWFCYCVEMYKEQDFWFIFQKELSLNKVSY